MSPNGEQDRVKGIFDVLALEYNALRSDILHRSSARFSMLAVGLGVFAVLAALIQVMAQMGGFTPARAIIISLLAIAYLIIVAVAWFNAGRSIRNLSNHLVVLERQINSLMKSGELVTKSGDLLTWEAEEQRTRGPLNRRLLGEPPRP